MLLLEKYSIGSFRKKNTYFNNLISAALQTHVSIICRRFSNMVTPNPGNQEDGSSALSACEAQGWIPASSLKLDHCGHDKCLHSWLRRSFVDITGNLVASYTSVVLDCLLITMRKADGQYPRALEFKPEDKVHQDCAWQSASRSTTVIQIIKSRKAVYESGCHWRVVATRRFKLQPFSISKHNSEHDSRKEMFEKQSNKWLAYLWTATYLRLMVDKLKPQNAAQQRSRTHTDYITPHANQCH